MRFIYSLFSYFKEADFIVKFVSEEVKKATRKLKPISAKQHMIEVASQIKRSSPKVNVTADKHDPTLMHIDYIDLVTIPKVTLTYEIGKPKSERAKRLLT